MRMRVLTTDGIRVIDLPHEWDRSIVGQYWNTINEYLRTGVSARLQVFDGVKIEGWQFETHPDRIDEWWSRGQLDFLEIYEG